MAYCKIENDCSSMHNGWHAISKGPETKNWRYQLIIYQWCPATVSMHIGSVPHTTWWLLMFIDPHCGWITVPTDEGCSWMFDSQTPRWSVETFKLSLTARKLFKHIELASNSAFGKKITFSISTPKYSLVKIRPIKSFSLANASLKYIPWKFAHPLWRGSLSWNQSPKNINGIINSFTEQPLTPTILKNWVLPT